MLGYPTHFGQMEAVKLLGGAGTGGRFADKRIGYLALNLLLDEKQETLMLVTNSLQQDLNSSNPYAVGLALMSIGNIAGGEMSRDLASDVDKLLKGNGQGANPYVRKKAALAAIRMIKKVPELIDQFVPSMVQLLLEKSHSVLLTGVSLVHAVVDTAPSYAPKLLKLVPALTKILRKLLTAGYSADFDVGGVADPFLQSRILSLMRTLVTSAQAHTALSLAASAGPAARTAGDQALALLTAASENLNSVLAQVASQTDTARNAGNAVLYEAVQCIMSLPPDGPAAAEEGLRVLAVNILGKFLGSSGSAAVTAGAVLPAKASDNNIRYVALSTLCRVVHRDQAAVQRHRQVIVECLKDGDVSIRKRALELVYALVTADNVRPLTKELLTYLSSLPPSDMDTRADVCGKIASVAEKFSPSLRWRVDTLISMLSQCGVGPAGQPIARKEVLSALVYHITHAPTAEEHAAIVHKLFAMGSAAVHNSASGAGTAGHGSQQQLLQVAVWCVGEYGNYLTRAPPSGKGAGDTDITGPYGEARTEEAIVRFLDRVRSLHYASADTIGMVLVAALKLSVRLSGEGAGSSSSSGGAQHGGVQDKLRRLIAVYGSAANVELQTRSVEFSLIANGGIPVVSSSASASGGGGGAGDDLMLLGGSGAGGAPLAQALADPAVKKGLLERMPLLEESVLRLRAAAGTGELGTDALRLGGEEQSMEVAAVGSVTGLAARGSSSAASAGAGASSAMADLEDLLGGLGGGSSGSGTPVAPAPASATKGGKGTGSSGGGGLADLDDLFGGVGASSGSSGASSTAPKAKAAQPQADLFDLMGSSPAPAPAPAPTALGSGGGRRAAALTSALDSLMLAGPAPSPAPPARLAAPAGGGLDSVMGALDDLLGSSAPSSATLGMGMGMGGAAARPPPAAAPAPSTLDDAFDAPMGVTPLGPVVHPPFTAFESPSGSGLRVTLQCSKPGGAGDSVTEITATYGTGGSAGLSNFMCQVAVPKTMKLTLRPASSATVPPHSAAQGGVVQTMRVENSQQGVKPLGKCAPVPDRPNSAPLVRPSHASLLPSLSFLCECVCVQRCDSSSRTLYRGRPRKPQSRWTSRTSLLACELGDPPPCT